MRRIAVLALLIFPSLLRAEDITIATYNIENFQTHFLARRLSATRPAVLPTNNPAVQELLENMRLSNEEDNWEIANVILDPKFSPDIMVIQEGCNQKDLEYFVKTWLDDKYTTVMVFPGNSDREQHVGMILKPGFKVIQKKDQYYLDKDPVANERGSRLFARGPAFVLVESPSGYRFWVGTTHQKSKSDNSVEVTKWRNREATRLHEIVKEIEKAGPSDVVLLGDMNDELWYQPFEQEAGGDAISLLIGPPADGLIHATRPLIDTGKISYFGYVRQDYRSLIDHIIVTRSMGNQIKEVKVFQNAFTAVASDHCPVIMRITADAAGRN